MVLSYRHKSDYYYTIKSIHTLVRSETRYVCEQPCALSVRWERLLLVVEREVTNLPD